jgi:hypothetical protein
VNSFAVLSAKQHVVVVFIEVYHAKAMDPRVPRFFFNHSVHDLFPAGKAVGIADAIVKERMVDGPDGVARDFEDE